MKKSIILIFLNYIVFFPSIVLGSSKKVYYCTDEKVIGFRPLNNYKITNFPPQRFKLSMNFKERTIKSKKILFIGDPRWDTCMINSETKELYCFNQIGSSFSLNTKTLKFHRAYIINFDTTEDDIIIAHGKCEIF